MGSARHPCDDESQRGKQTALQHGASRENALQHALTYVIARVEHEPDLSHIDRWYVRDAGERVGLYNLYRLKLRQ